MTREIVRALIPKLKKRGHTVYDSTIDRAATTNAYLQSVCKLANRVETDLFLSIHLNASMTHLGKGVECYTWRGNKVKQATRICSNLSALGFKNRGIKDGSHLYVVKHTKPTAILVEVFFLDNYTDRKLFLEHGAEGIAEAIAKAI